MENESHSLWSASNTRSHAELSELRSAIGARASSQTSLPLWATAPGPSVVLGDHGRASLRHGLHACAQSCMRTGSVDRSRTHHRRAHIDFDGRCSQLASTTRLMDTPYMFCDPLTQPKGIPKGSSGAEGRRSSSTPDGALCPAARLRPLMPSIPCLCTCG